MLVIPFVLSMILERKPAHKVGGEISRVLVDEINLKDKGRVSIYISEQELDLHPQLWWTCRCHLGRRPR
jgi:hypothetical protein